MQLEQKAAARGNASVVQAGRDVINGNVFVGRYARLRDVWLDPTPVFEEVEVDRFVGREWLVGPVDRFVGSRDRGYVVVQAAAGLGKTAFAAWLAKSRDWPCHFTRRRKGRNLVTALRNLGAQLIARYQLSERFAPGGMLPETAGEPGWFERVLREAAKAADDKLVLVVDGLDEAEHVAGDLPLGLPSVLPANVFMVVTCRTGTGLSALRQPWTAVRFEAGDRRNITDLQEYLEAAATQGQLARLLADNTMAVDSFVRQLMDRCGGVWVYLRYVLDELRYELRTVDQLDKLPEDLASYYSESLTPSTVDPQWDSLTLPVLTTLAAVVEPIPAGMLARLAGVANQGEVRALCDDRLRPFLTVDANRRYAIYHASLREFLAGAAGQHTLDRARSRAEELAEATVAAHSRIADHYLSGLPASAFTDDGYPRRYLTYHLEHAGRQEDLQRLLAEERDGRNLWFDVHDRAGSLEDYIADLRRARRAAPFSLQIRYAVMTSAVTSLTANIPAPLLARLVKDGFWSIGRALNHAKQLHNPAAKAEALIWLIPHLGDRERETAVTDALATAQAIVSSDWRSIVIADLLPHLAGQQRDRAVSEVLGAIEATDDVVDRIKALAYSIPLLDEVHYDSVFACARAVPHHDKAWALQLISEELPEPHQGRAVAESYAAIEVSTEEDRPYVLAGLAPLLAADQREQARAQALELARGSEDAVHRFGVLMAVAQGLDGSARDDLLLEAFEEANAMVDDGQRARALATVGNSMPEPQRHRVLAEALAAASAVVDEDAVRDTLNRLAVHLPEQVLASATSLTNDFYRSWLLARMAPKVPKQLVPALLSATRTVVYDQGHAQVLGAVAAQLPEPQRSRHMADALALARNISTPSLQARVLTDLAGKVPVDERESLALEALTAARMETKGFKAMRLAWLVRRLPDHMRGEVAIEAMAAVPDLDHPPNWLIATDMLVPYLAEPMRGRLLADVLAGLQKVPSRYFRVVLVAMLTVHLPEPQQGRILAETLAEARGLPDQADQVTATVRKVARLTRVLPDKLILEILTAAHAAVAVSTESTDPVAAEKLARFFRLVPKSLVLQILSVSRLVPGNSDPTAIIGTVALRLPEPLRARALDEALTTARDTSFARRVIMQQAHELGEHDPDLVLRCLDTLGLDDCLSVLASAVPIVYSIGGVSALRDCLESIQLVERWWFSADSQ